jgi:hypothetical protein
MPALVRQGVCIVQPSLAQWLAALLQVQRSRPRAFLRGAKTFMSLRTCKGVDKEWLRPDELKPVPPVRMLALPLRAESYLGSKTVGLSPIPSMVACFSPNFYSPKFWLAQPIFIWAELSSDLAVS